MSNIEVLSTSQAILHTASEAISQARRLTAFDLDTTHIFWELEGAPYLSIDTQLAKPLIAIDEQTNEEEDQFEIVQALLLIDDGDVAANLGINTLWGEEQLAMLDKDEYARFVLESFAKSFYKIKGVPVPVKQKIIAISHIPTFTAREAELNQHKYLTMAT